MLKMDFYIKNMTYNFGIKWQYWTKFKHSKYFVNPQYKCLKNELLNNKIFGIKIIDWNNTMKESNINLKSVKSRKLKHNH